LGQQQGAVVVMWRKEGPLQRKDMLWCIEVIGEIGSLKDGHGIIVETREATKKQMVTYVINLCKKHLCSVVVDVGKFHSRSIDDDPTAMAR
jgi:hypothetical protein